MSQGLSSNLPDSIHRPNVIEEGLDLILTHFEVSKWPRKISTKSNPYIVMVSTPNAPEGLFERIEKEAEDTCLYKRIFLDYTYGIGKIYTAEEIEKSKQSPSFEREYNLKYLGRIGNVFHTKDIEAAIEKGRKYDPDDFNRVYLTSRSMGIDPAWGQFCIWYRGNSMDG